MSAHHPEFIQNTNCAGSEMQDLPCMLVSFQIECIPMAFDFVTDRIMPQASVPPEVALVSWFK